ncbi:unnamed protein product [Ilex paraguariensis]|uniref:Uncharacterized protein n=1 Tax=Ilex paraguariensis TaxID=185542 RepID=A0ABC8TC03_9AQUA
MEKKGEGFYTSSSKKTPEDPNRKQKHGESKEKGSTPLVRTKPQRIPTENKSIEKAKRLWFQVSEGVQRKKIGTVETRASSDSLGSTDFLKK